MIHVNTICYSEKMSRLETCGRGLDRRKDWWHHIRTSGGSGRRRKDGRIRSSDWLGRSGGWGSWWYGRNGSIIRSLDDWGWCGDSLRGGRHIRGSSVGESSFHHLSVILGLGSGLRLWRLKGGSNWCGRWRSDAREMHFLDRGRSRIRSRRSEVGDLHLVNRCGRSGLWNDRLDSNVIRSDIVSRIDWASRGRVGGRVGTRRASSGGVAGDGGGFVIDLEISRILRLLSRSGGGGIVIIMNDFVAVDIRGDQLLVGAHGHELRSEAESVGIGMIVRKAIGGSDDTGEEGGSDIGVESGIVGTLEGEN